MTKFKPKPEDYQNYIELSPTAIFVANPEGQYIYVNQAAMDLLNYSKEELLSIRIPDIVFEEDLEKVMKEFGQLKEEGRITRDYTLKRKDGSGVEVKLNATKLPSGDVLAFCEDITYLRNMEKKLKERVDQLEEINRYMVDRELKMVELKKEIADLKAELDEKSS
ncbi:PAS domain S-box protein [candidate division WWE3 bacterium]|nr:PAS domain S-box protein [candidate division WWE3 bacterium]